VSVVSAMVFATSTIELGNRREEDANVVQCRNNKEKEDKKGGDEGKTIAMQCNTTTS